MVAREDLFSLIKSLKRTEKRYFKLYASQFKSKDNHTLIQLFDAIDNMGVYSETTLKNHFKDEKFVAYLSVIKRKLESLVLKSLNAYYAAKIETNLQGLLSSIHILYNKGLFDFCERLVANGKKLANQHEKIYYELMFADWQCRLLQRKGQYKLATQVVESELPLLAMQKDTILLRHQIFSVSDIILHQGFAQDKLHLEPFQNILNSSKYPKKENLQTTKAKIYYYALQNMKFSIQRNYTNSAETCAKMITLFESKPSLIEDDITGYVSLLINYAKALYNCRNFIKLKTINKKIEAFCNNVAQHKSYEAWSASIVFYNELYILMSIRSGDKTAVLRQVNKIEKVVANYNTHYRKRSLLPLFFNIASALFIVGSLDKSLQWLNIVIIESGTSQREDLHVAARLMILFVHFELGNFQLLENIIPTTEKYLMRKNKLTKTEKYIISFFKQAIKGKLPMETLLRKLQLQTADVKSNSFEYLLLRLLNIKEWILSKLNKESMYNSYLTQLLKHE